MTTFSLHPELLKNTGYGTVTLLATELSKLCDGDTNIGHTVVSTGVVDIVADLFNRYEISEVRYWKSSGTVQFFVSTNGVSWVEISVVSGVGYVFSTLDPSLFTDWPRFIRVRHTISSAPSTIYELQVLNLATKQGYWFDGSKDVLMVDADGVEVSPVQVYNRSSGVKNFYCLIDIENSVDDGSTIKLATSSGGPFYGKYDKGVVSNRDFVFSSGQFSGTQVSGTSVVLSPTSGTGYYYTPIFQFTDTVPRRLFWEQTSSVNGKIDWDTQVDSHNSIAFRVSNKVPSGGWVNGTSPVSTDAYWGVLSGSLPYAPITNNTIIEINAGQYNYIQAAVKFSTTVLSDAPALTNIGVEEALNVGPVSPSDYKEVYALSTASSFVNGDNANILSFFIEDEQ